MKRKAKKEGRPASCGTPLAAVRFLTGIGEIGGSFLYRLLHLSRVGLDENFQYVVGGYCRWIGIVKPIVELALLHSGIATSFLADVPCTIYERPAENSTNFGTFFPPCKDNI